VQHGDLKFRLSGNTVVRMGQAEDPAHEEVEEELITAEALSQTGSAMLIQPAIVFWTPRAHRRRQC